MVTNNEHHLLRSEVKTQMTRISNEFYFSNNAPKLTFGFDGKQNFGDKTPKPPLKGREG